MRPQQPERDILACLAAPPRRSASLLAMADLTMLAGRRARSALIHRAVTEARPRACRISVFDAFDIELHNARGHKPDLMAKGCQLSRPEVGRGARLHADQAGRQTPEEADEFTPAELTADQNLSILIDAMNLEHMLGEIETYCRDLHWSGSLSGAEAITLSHRALPGAGAVHPIIYGAGLVTLRGSE
jgi:hypothetical protein